MDTAKVRGTLSTGWRWVARFVASLFLLLGALVFTSFIETNSPLLFAMAVLGIGGAFVFIFGIERPQHPLARRTRQVGWAMMAAFSLVPTSLLFIPLLAVALAFPAVIRTPRTLPTPHP